MAAGLSLGAAPTVFVDRAVESSFQLAAVAAQDLQRRESVMESLPDAWKIGVRMLADGGEVRRIRGGALEEELVRELSKTPRGRARSNCAGAGRSKNPLTRANQRQDGRASPAGRHRRANLTGSPPPRRQEAAAGRARSPS